MFQLNLVGVEFVLDCNFDEVSADNSRSCCLTVTPNIPLPFTNVVIIGADDGDDGTVVNLLMLMLMLMLPMLMMLMMTS